MAQLAEIPMEAPSAEEIEALRKHAGEAANLLKALASENRLLILCTLAGGEMSVSELNAQINLSQSGLSQQLAILRRDRLVNTRRQSQAIYYSVAPSNAMPVIQVLKELYCPELIKPAHKKKQKAKR